VGRSLPRRQRDYQMVPNWGPFRGCRSWHLHDIRTRGLLAQAFTELLDADFAALSPKPIAPYLFQRVHFPRHHTYLLSPPHRAGVGGALE
jgi:hypothetical protein